LQEPLSQSIGARGQGRGQKMTMSTAQTRERRQHPLSSRAWTRNCRHSVEKMMKKVRTTGKMRSTLASPKTWVTVNERALRAVQHVCARQLPQPQRVRVRPNKGARTCCCVGTWEPGLGTTPGGRLARAEPSACLKTDQPWPRNHLGFGAAPPVGAWQWLQPPRVHTHPRMAAPTGF